MLSISNMGTDVTKVRSKLPSGLRRLSLRHRFAGVFRSAPTMMFPAVSSAMAVIELLNVMLAKLLSRDPSEWNCRTRLPVAAIIRWSGRMAMVAIDWPN